MLTFLAGNRFLPYILTATAACLMVVSIYVAGRSQGYANAEAEFKHMMEMERKRLQSINERAIQRAQEQVEQLELELEERNDIILEIMELPDGDGTVVIDGELLRLLEQLN